MRKLLLTCALIAVAAPAVALAGKSAPGDGTLQVRDGNGFIFVQVRGALIGRCANCVVTIDDPVQNDGSGAIVFGADRAPREITDTATRYVNKSPRTDMRFRIVGGLSRVTVNGDGISLSVVGQGFATLRANVMANDPGEYALDGGDFAPLPFLKQRVALGGPPSANSGG
jgi:hypothetical protein